LQEVNAIFKDVANLVDEQGDTLNSAEDHVEVAVTETGRGVVELEKASKYQASTKKKVLCMLACVIILVIVVGAIVAGVVAG
jgi:t-SNARE complex subunit (syntaxin)